MTLRLTALDMRREIITRLSDTTREMVLDSYPGKDPHEVVNACKEVLWGYMALVHGLSTSSSSAYAERDLPVDEQRTLACTRHNLRALDALYADGRAMPTAPRAVCDRPQA